VFFTYRGLQTVILFGFSKSSATKLSRQKREPCAMEIAAAFGVFAPEVLWGFFAVLSGVTGYAVFGPALAKDQETVAEGTDPLLPREKPALKKRKTPTTTPQV
jgi:hypothetical protein